MAENQIDLNDNRKKQLGRYMELMPEMTKHLAALSNEVGKDGALDGKTKRLLALATALGAGCRNCILAQTEAALEAGATKEDVLETISVVVKIRGTSGLAESLRVIQFLDELGKL